MNTNAPEKIYINDFGSELSYDWHTEHCAENDIKYVMEDTFIEKTEEYLYKQLNEGNMECGDIETFIENFKKYMKGE